MPLAAIPVRLTGAVHPLRLSRGATVVTVIIWQLAALVLLPAALCCHAALAHDGDGDVPACCKGTHDGAACPMNRGSGAEHASGMDHGPAHGEDAEADRGQSTAAYGRLHGCHLLDDTLVALSGLAGLTSETFRLAGDPVAAERLPDTRVSLVSLHEPPATPPPRA